MKKLLKILTFFFALQSLIPFFKPQDRSLKTLLWMPKLIAGALTPIQAIVCGLGAFVGLIRRDWKLASAGLIGAGLAAKFMEEVPESQDQFEATFGSDWKERIPTWLASRMLPARFSLPAKFDGEVQFEQDLVFGQNPQSGADLLADLWQPTPDSPRSGLGIVFLHGSGWRVGDKDMGTRSFFQRLASQGHVILDIAYTLFPKADLPTMVTEANLAIRWLKAHSAELEINPGKMVLMGASAGGHLALTAAYSAGNPAFQPPGDAIDTSVCGVVGIYPPVDLVALRQPFGEYAETTTPELLEKAADGMMRTIFMLGEDRSASRTDMIAEMLGGTPEDIPDTYRLLSPLRQVGPHCPPTLLLQGSDDFFDLAPGVRQLHTKLQETGIPVVCMEFPHTEHAFDLVLPTISPVAQAAIYDVERFLAMLI
jgi:acetyl esterase/lipase